MLVTVSNIESDFESAVSNGLEKLINIDNQEVLPHVLAKAVAIAEFLTLNSEQIMRKYRHHRYELVQLARKSVKEPHSLDYKERDELITELQKVYDEILRKGRRFPTWV